MAGQGAANAQREVAAGILEDGDVEVGDWVVVGGENDRVFRREASGLLVRKSCVYERRLL